MYAREQQESIVCRGTVRQIKENKGKIRIAIDGRHEFSFQPDDKLSHDIGLAVQDYFRRRGIDRPMR